MLISSDNSTVSISRLHGRTAFLLKVDEKAMLFAAMNDHFLLARAKQFHFHSQISVTIVGEQFQIQFRELLDHAVIRRAATPRRRRPPGIGFMNLFAHKMLATVPDSEDRSLLNMNFNSSGVSDFMQQSTKKHAFQPKNGTILPPRVISRAA